MTPATTVIFRIDLEGIVFALFPELPADKQGFYCTCYQHIGQHCAADYHGCMFNSDPAKPDEFADLQRELEQRGYKLTIRNRATSKMHQRRHEEART